MGFCVAILTKSVKRYFELVFQISIDLTTDLKRRGAVVDSQML